MSYYKENTDGTKINLLDNVAVNTTSKTYGFCPCDYGFNGISPNYIPRYGSGKFGGIWGNEQYTDFDGLLIHQTSTGTENMPFVTRSSVMTLSNDNTYSPKNTASFSSTKTSQLEIRYNEGYLEYKSVGTWIKYSESPARKHIIVFLIGGGGNGGSANKTGDNESGGGGGAGGEAKLYIDLSSYDSISLNAISKDTSIICRKDNTFTTMIAYKGGEGGSGNTNHGGDGGKGGTAHVWSVTNQIYVINSATGKDGNAGTDANDNIAVSGGNGAKNQLIIGYNYGEGGKGGGVNSSDNIIAAGSGQPGAWFVTAQTLSGELLTGNYSFDG